MPTEKSIADSTHIEDEEENLPVLTAPIAVAKPQCGYPPMPPGGGKITKDIEQYILQGLKNGERIDILCSNCKIQYASWWTRLTKNPPLMTQYREAQKAKADLQVKEIEQLAANTTEDDWHAAKVKLLARQWLAGAFDRERFGPGAQTQIALQQQLAPQITIVMGDKAKGDE